MFHHFNHTTWIFLGKINKIRNLLSFETTFITLLLYAFKATFRLAILAIKNQFMVLNEKKNFKLLNKFKKNVNKTLFLAGWKRLFHIFAWRNKLGAKSQNLRGYNGKAKYILHTCIMRFRKKMEKNWKWGQSF